MSENQRWIQSTFRDQLFASSRWKANMISSFLGSLRFGSIAFDFGTNWLLSVPSSLRSALPLPLRSPRNDQVCTPPVWIEFGLTLPYSDVYIDS
jgi:hypothetical protein